MLPRAKLTVAGRRQLVQRILAEGWPVARAAEAQGVSSVATAYQWLRRWPVEGDAGLADRLPRPHSSPRRLPAERERAILAWRRATRSAHRPERPQPHATPQQPPREPHRAGPTAGYIKSSRGSASPGGSVAVLAAGVGEGLAGLRDELPVVAPGVKRQLQHAVGAAVADLAVGRGVEASVAELLPPSRR